MGIADLIRIVKQRWLVMVACVVSGLVLAGAYWATATPEYEAKGLLFVSLSSGASINDVAQGSVFAQGRVRSYPELVTTPRVLQSVIDDLHLNTTPEELAQKITVNIPIDTVLLEITAADPNPVRARDIANAVTKSFPSVIQEWETPPGQVIAPIRVSVTRAATTPKHPVRPRLVMDIFVGVGLGMLLGLVTAILKETLDKSVNTKEEVQDITGVPVVGLVADLDAEAAKHQLITHDAFSPRAEAFRQLRTNIRFLSVDHRVGSIVVTSAVPHEGKSTTSANLAIALAQAGESVILIDADLRRPTVADVFALSAGVGLTSVLLGDLDIDEAVQVWREDLPLHVLTAGPLPPNPSELIGSARMAALISDLVERGVTVVLDSPPLLPVTDAALLARATDGALVVTRAGKTHTEQLAAACEALRITGATVLGVVLNRVSRKKSSSGYYGSYEGYHSDPNKKANRAAAAPAAPSTLPWPTEATEPTGDVVPAVPPAPAAAAAPEPMPEPAPVQAAAPAFIELDAPAPEQLAPYGMFQDADLIASDPLPPAVREIIAPGATAPPTMHRPRGSARRAARAAEPPLSPSPDMVIDADSVTISPVGLRPVGGNPVNWPSEWGNLPALINGQRVNGEVNGANGNGRHRT